VAKEIRRQLFTASLIGDACALGTQWFYDLDRVDPLWRSGPDGVPMSLFVILALGTDKDGAVHLAEVLREKIAGTAFDSVGQLTASFGVAELANGESEREHFERADKALYQAKLEGRNQVVAASR